MIPQQSQKPSSSSAAAGAPLRRGSRNNRSRNNRSRNNRSRRTAVYGRDERGYQGLNNNIHPGGVGAVTGMHAPETCSPAPILEIPKTFYCQLAHGGPTAVIPTPNNLGEVYEAIASKFDGMSPDDILYCTVNTFKADMDNLLSTNLKVNDFIFAHCHGTRKEVTLTKSDAMLGVTLTDNGYGKVFIKRIHPDSVAARSQPAVLVGDHVEKINGETVVGQRHYNVASMLRAIPVGENFTLRLVEPQKSGFSFVGPRSGSVNATQPKTNLESAGAAAIEDGNQTLRFRSNGNAVMQEAPSKVVINKINEIFETYLGFNDDVLALAGWEIASKASNFVDLKNLFADSDLGGFGFPDELLFDIWGAVDDYRKKRLPTSAAAATDQSGEKKSTSQETSNVQQQKD